MNFQHPNRCFPVVFHIFLNYSTPILSYKHDDKVRVKKLLDYI